MTEKMFDYNKAIEELEQIALKVEDPSTSIDQIDKFLARSKELTEACRNYLRSVREKIDDLQDN